MRIHASFIFWGQEVATADFPESIGGVPEAAFALLQWRRLHPVSDFFGDVRVVLLEQDHVNPKENHLLVPLWVNPESYE